eukprot:15003718-Heterocapsa_arctica.AAC.1
MTVTARGGGYGFPNNLRGGAKSADFAPPRPERSVAGQVSHRGACQSTSQRPWAGDPFPDLFRVRRGSRRGVMPV